MPKLILEYQMPEDKSDYEMALNASKYAGIINEFKNELRQKIKYESDSLSDAELKVYEDIRTRLHQIIIDNLDSDHPF